jgi:hypothetical protein
MFIIPNECNTFDLFGNTQNIFKFLNIIFKSSV